MYIKGLLNSPSFLKRLHKEWPNPQCITMLDMSVCENETDELVKIIEQKNESTPSLIGQFFFSYCRQTNHKSLAASQDSFLLFLRANWVVKKAKETLKDAATSDCLFLLLTMAWTPNFCHKIMWPSFYLM